MSGFSSPSDASLRVLDATVIRGGRIVLDSLSFDVRPGEALILSGPNGAGKSTLLRCLAGLTPLQGGAITLDGLPTTDPEHPLALAFLGHQDALKPGLTVRENLALTARLGSTSIDVALDQVGLADFASLPARLLSAGQKRRAALARILLRHARLWLLDEPSLGLDSDAVIRLGEIMATHRNSGGMIITTTHIPLPLVQPRNLSLHLNEAGDTTWS